jgi:hypothetical protein
MRIDLRDKTWWVALSLGVPALFAVGVLAWGMAATNVPGTLPDPSASPILGIAPDGQPVRLAPTLAPATPTPARRPDAYRVEGVVVDDLGLPIVGACIEIGPNGCREHSPRTDGRGVYYADLPKGDLEWDLHFTKEGFKPIVKRIHPTSDSVLNIMLGR